MGAETISSSSNIQLKNIQLLQKKRKAREEQGIFVCEGRKLYEEAREQGLACIRKVYIAESFFALMLEEESDYLDGLEYEVVQDRLFDSISETVTPQGILALVLQNKYQLRELLVGDRVKLLLLEDIQDPGNLGTMLRTAEAAGFTGLIMSKNTVDIYNPKVIRSTMGSIFRLPFVYVEDICQTIRELEEENICIYAAHLRGGVYYDRINYPNRCGLLIGNEGNGLTKDAVGAAGACVKIPMSGKVESLNAGVAAALLMYAASHRSMDE